MKKVWVITGANRGIGRAIAEEALAQGDQVVCTARQPEQLSELASRHPNDCWVVRLDMNEESSLVPAARECLNAFGRVDVLVNNAGFGLQGMAEEVALAQVRQQMETNFFGLVGFTQPFITALRTQGSGWIVNISSIAGLRGSASFSMYNASKFAVEGYGEALALELEPFGVNVSNVEPGPYRTDWAGNSLHRSEAMKGLSIASPYFSENKRIKDIFDERSGRQPGDPVQIARVLVTAAHSGRRPPMHMVFGEMAIKLAKEHADRLRNTDYMNFYPHEQYTF
jgi:NAD(P)-dependent dehydrogenase (short-subunit alcohol dehydrogenase family)